MALADAHLIVMPFPQRWDGEALSLNVLVGIVGNPLQPLSPGQPAFADARLHLAAHLIRGLEKLPAAADVTATRNLGTFGPAGKRAVFERLATQFSIDPVPTTYTPPLSSTHFKKLLMTSYMDATGHRRPRTPYAVTDESYVCAIVNGPRPKSRPPKLPAPPKWESVIAFALRQPVLAERLGLLVKGSIEPDESFFEEGGWIYATLHADSDYATALASTPDYIRHYVARVPPLEDDDRPVFAAVLFPLQAPAGVGNYDELLAESELYDDGFARVVHTYQADRDDILNLSGDGDKRQRPHTDTGIRLGWDDEQVVVWLNRQLTEDPRNNPLSGRDTPLGVRGYRVDVRDADGPGPWASLVRMKGDLSLGSVQVGHFDDEMAVEVIPSQLQGERDGEYWLPPYFAKWTGFSLIAQHDLADQLDGVQPEARRLAPTGVGLVPLKYGGNYHFRVRLADLTGGGPRTGDPMPALPPTVTSLCRFRRYVPPGRVHFAPPDEQSSGATLTFEIPRPRVGYPTALYTPLADPAALLLADRPQASIDGRPASIPDPDVALLRIDVAVAGLEFDPDNERDTEPRRRLYTTTRAFPPALDGALQLRIKFQDKGDLDEFPAPLTSGDLFVPTSREVIVTLTPIARRDPAFAAPSTPDLALAEMLDWSALSRADRRLEYFGNQAARVGGAMTFRVRRHAADETGLLVETGARSVQALLLRPTPTTDAYQARVQAAAGRQTEAPASLVERLADRLNLDLSGTTFSAPAGQRLVVGCSPALHHVLSPEHGSVTFASEAEVTGQWIVGIPLRLDRDWTWDGVEDRGFEVRRSLDGGAEGVVGSIDVRRSLSGHAWKGRETVRSATELLFLDAIDPKPAAGEHPAEIRAVYRIAPRFRTAPEDEDDPIRIELRLPMAAPPRQTPRLASAGLALSAYAHDEPYSTTSHRRRQLWLELAEPVLAPGDALFARVLSYAPDPILTDSAPGGPPGPQEPPLNIDPETTRAVIPGQTPDTSGLDAMQLMEPASDDGPTRHYLLPRPPGLNELSPELFGFFVYEIRVGHRAGWSTAQARFGPPLRVTGVQHPAPPLSCGISRVVTGIRVSAAYATPVDGGQIVRPDPPRTSMWGLLYAQVPQADGSAWRNILLGRCPMRINSHHLRGRAGAEPQGFGFWDQDDIEAWLRSLALPHGTPLSVVVAELLPEESSPFEDPLGRDLGQVRMLRVSPLTPVPAVCVD